MVTKEQADELIRARVNAYWEILPKLKSPAAIAAFNLQVQENLRLISSLPGLSEIELAEISNKLRRELTLLNVESEKATNHG